MLHPLSQLCCNTFSLASRAPVWEYMSCFPNVIVWSVVGLGPASEMSTIVWNATWMDLAPKWIFWPPILFTVRCMPFCLTTACWPAANCNHYSFVYLQEEKEDEESGLLHCWLFAAYNTALQSLECHGFACQAFLAPDPHQWNKLEGIWHWRECPALRCWFEISSAVEGDCAVARDVAFIATLGAARYGSMLSVHLANLTVCTILYQVL